MQAKMGFPINTKIDFQSILKTFLVVTLLCAQESHSKRPVYCTADSEESKPEFPLCSGRFKDLSASRDKQGFNPHDELFPPWINITLAKEGQKFAQDYLAPLLHSHIFGMILDISFPDTAHFLIYGNHSLTPQDAAKRYIATFAQLQVWYDDFFKDGDDHGDIATSLLNVRNVHIGVSRRAVKKLKKNPEPLISSTIMDDYEIDEKLWRAVALDLERSNIPESSRQFISSFLNEPKVPVNQLNQALAQFAFVGYPTLFPQRIGISASDDEIWAFLHLWAVLGYALGLEDEYNICLQPDLATAREYFQKIYDVYIVPTYFNMDHNTLVLEDILLKGFNTMMPMLKPASMLYRVLIYVLNIKAPNLFKYMSPSEQADEMEFKTSMTLFGTNAKYLAKMNKAFRKAISDGGHTYFGSIFDTQTSRAEAAFYA